MGAQAMNGQPLLPFPEDAADRRAALVARWIALVRVILPGMAQRCSWPISQDHCFMRVCLDAALGAPWRTVVRPPAIRRLSDGQLAAAIAVAEGLIGAPETLEALNRQSLRWRRQARLAGRPEDLSA